VAYMHYPNAEHQCDISGPHINEFTCHGTSPGDWTHEFPDPSEERVASPCPRLDEYKIGTT